RFVVGILQLLPHLVKEQPRFLEGSDIYPTVVIQGGKAHETTNICATFEDLRVDVADVVAGLTAVIEIYWIFN
ncbi:hypothetical protein HPB47_016206, partial [Ixodes persulcatus]